MTEFTEITEEEFERLRSELEGGGPVELNWRPLTEFGQ